MGFSCCSRQLALFNLHPHPYPPSSIFNNVTAMGWTAGYQQGGDEVLIFRQNGHCVNGVWIFSLTGKNRLSAKKTGNLLTCMVKPNSSWFSPRMVYIQKTQDAYMDVSGRAMQEQLPRSGSFASCIKRLCRLLWFTGLSRFNKAFENYNKRHPFIPVFWK